MNNDDDEKTVLNDLIDDLIKRVEVENSQWFKASAIESVSNPSSSTLEEKFDPNVKTDGELRAKNELNLKSKLKK